MALNIGKGWHGESQRHSLARRGISTGSKSKLDFPKGKGMDVHAAITVPSTTSADKPISKREHRRRAKEVETFLSKKFGGYTEVEAKGGWVSDEKGLIKEPVIVVHSYTDSKTYREHDLEVQAFIEKKKKKWKQESMAYEFEESLHFV